MATMAGNIVRFNPLAELEALQRQFFGDDFYTSFRGANLATTDVYMEGDNQLTIEAHLPNFEEEDITVSVDEGALVIQAERRDKEEDKSKKYVVRESSSSFYRRISLPQQTDDANIRADFTGGVLKVTVPMKELPSPKRIAIGTGSK
jgi:HSP20 family protein